MTYTAEDLERATSLLETHSFMQSMDGRDNPKLAMLIAYCIADVRREALEEAINACRPTSPGSKYEGGLYVAMERIRALLKDGDK